MDIRKLAVAMAIGGASLGAGFSLAGAQESPSPTTPPSTEAPAQPDGDGTAPERDGRNCDKDGDGVPDNRGSDTDASNAGFFQS